jgi:HSP20 family molecular chaperone IbpA
MSTLSLWTRRDPFADFDAVVRAAFGGSFTPAAETRRDGDDAVIRLELPGLDVERDVTVELDHGRLVVSGERRDERSDETDGRSLREVRYGSFRRVFGVPAQVNADAVSASYDAGVLTVRVSGAYASPQGTRIPVTAAPTVESPSGG